MKKIDSVTLGMIWDRLISITDELLLSIVRTSFSITVREAWDVGCVVFDERGRPIAQGAQSTPAFTGTAFYTMEHLLQRFPADTLKEGDVIITNDPWIGTGHVPDVSVARPVFHQGILVGFVMTITHLTDVGGRGLSTLSKEIYEEGMVIPPSKICEAGRINELLLDIIRANVRTPEQVLGDIYANISATHVGSRELEKLLIDYRLTDLTEVSNAIINHSEIAIRERIQAMPDGQYQNKIMVDALETPIWLACELDIQGDEIRIDFAGSNDTVPYAINVPITYTRSWAAYTLKSLTTPELPNNMANIIPLTVSAPENCILNAQRPAATCGRNTVGWYVVPLLLGAFAKAAPHLAQAEMGMAMTTVFKGKRRDGGQYIDQYFATGGVGARNGADGQPATPAPTNCALVSTEVWENQTHITIEQRRILPDSGGAGEFRGGPGQEITMRNTSEHPVQLSLFGLRTRFQAQGVQGGKCGGLRRFQINGETISPRGFHPFQPNDTYTIIEAGGGGFGEPEKREKYRIEQDLKRGFVTLDGARRDYCYGDSSS